MPFRCLEIPLYKEHYNLEILGYYMVDRRRSLEERGRNIFQICDACQGMNFELRGFFVTALSRLEQCISESNYSIDVENYRSQRRKLLVVSFNQEIFFRMLTKSQCLVKLPGEQMPKMKSVHLQQKDSKFAI